MIDILKSIESDIKSESEGGGAAIYADDSTVTLKPLCPVCYEFACDCVKRKLKPEEVIFGATSGSKEGVTSGSGRGPTGKMRNFKAMGDTKLAITISQIAAEGFDNEAYNTCSSVCRGRGIPVPQFTRFWVS